MYTDLLEPGSAWYILSPTISHESAESPPAAAVQKEEKVHAVDVARLSHVRIVSQLFSRTETSED